MVSHKPTKAKDAGEQLSLEKKAFEKRNRHRPVLGEKLLKSREVKLIEQNHDRRDYE